jgi:RNA polymerase-binding transcription factor DksA
MMSMTPLIPWRLDDAPLSRAAIDEIRDALLDEVRIQRQIMVEADAGIDSVAGQDVDDAGGAVEVYARARARALAVTADLEAALARIERGTYGSCEDCGTAIPAIRLEAIPYARTCVQCPVVR